MNKALSIMLILLAILVILAGTLFAYKYATMPKQEVQNEIVSVGTDIEKEQPLIVPEKKVQIFNGDNRAIAVMIDNHSGAWPQANLSKAYLVYEIVVEGGETRLMAVFKGQDLEKIGPVRSSRHYFLDYALENDAIYVHHGWSPQAQADIPELGVNNINGITESSKNFWRVKDKSAPHNLMTSTQSILSIAERKEYKTTSTKESILNYVADEFDLTDKYEMEKIEVEMSQEEEALVNKIEEEESTSVEEIKQNKTMAMQATTVTIPHSKLQTVKYEYNEETKTYTRYARKKLQTDYITGDPVVTKNIIITMCDNYTLQDVENKGRQGLKNIGTFDGYYITNGKAIKIKCTKVARDKQTVYKDLEGNEIQVNDGNTFINICPTNADVVIE